MSFHIHPGQRKPQRVKEYGMRVKGVMSPAWWCSRLLVANPLMVKTLCRRVVVLG